MTKTKTKAFARAGLLGNPSDGFGGKTISFSIGQFFASVELEPADSLEMVSHPSESNQFQSVKQLVQKVERQGYYGATRLILASIKRFFDYFDGRPNCPNFDRSFRISYDSNIPRAVGMAGSSAIIVATLRALEDFYGVQVQRNVLPSLVMSVEFDELGIPAGLQDRVIQCYQGWVYMDFSSDQSSKIDGFQCGNYYPLPKSALFDQLYVSFADEAGQPTEVLHSDLRRRFLEHDSVVVDAMKQFASFAEQGRAAIDQNDRQQLDRLIDANFDLRAAICDLHSIHVQMIETARACGASAKYCGSGGAIVGLCDDQSFARLCQEMLATNCTTIRPKFVDPMS